ncbi:lysophospholipid acyltransferase family protein [Marinicauda algicola]|uniref:lysophospholipid acyltransferase family protein n=1 Tax=Marinicauda algicola TaxID=2029849 RepID=UPI0013052CD6|nr:lysophospholipid acyltransferase family protein [Marinicauda algicola]
MSLRAHIYHTGFWTISGTFALLGTPTLLARDRGPVTGWLHAYTRAMRAWLKTCGVEVEYRGLEHLPEGPAVFAAKHQSYADGILHVAHKRDLAYVIGDHMLKFPLIGTYLERAEAVVVDDAAGKRAGDALETAIARLKAQQRDILIFPEGGMAPVGGKKRYRRGVHRLASALERPVVPVATNLGCFWPRQEWRLHPGRAVIEYLPPLTPVEDRNHFRTLLERTIESRTRALEAEAHAAGRRKG